MQPERLASIWGQYVAHVADSLKAAQLAREGGAASQALQQAEQRIELLASEAVILLMNVALANPACSRVSCLFEAQKSAG